MERTGDSVTIPYFAHEGEMARMERANKRLWIIIIILIVALIGTNAGWLVYESQYQTETVTTESYEASADGGGNAVLNGSGEVNIFGGEGEVHKDYGQTESESIFSGSEDLP